MNNIANIIGMAILITIAVGIILSFPIMWLWNFCLVPAAPILVEITWLQAWGIYVLFGILFKPTMKLS